MTQPTTPMGRQIGEKVVRVTIAVVGLLILHAILSALPMLKRPVLYMASGSGPATSSPLTIDPQTLAQWVQFIGQEIQQAGGQSWEYYSNALIRAHLAIFPVTIANAVVDTLIFIVLILFGRDLSSIIRTGYPKLPDLGHMLNFGIIAGAVAIGYSSYQGIFYPLLFPDNVDIYSWVFLVLGLAPLVGIAVLVARNMDSLTAAVMRSGERPVAELRTVSCESCGRPVTVGTKFCPNCGVPMSVSTAKDVAEKQFCPSCGAENPATGKFCRSCGQAMA
jgi:ribosomal protein L40E